MTSKAIDVSGNWMNLDRPLSSFPEWKNEKPKNLQHQRICKRYDEGLDILGIAQATGSSRDTVKRVLIRYGKIA